MVPGLEQPATFGVIRPVVLLPGNTCAKQPLEIQRALVAHELIHVQRRDWLWVLCEELLLAALWFNPAMWWIVVGSAAHARGIGRRDRDPCHRIPA